MVNKLNLLQTPSLILVLFALCGCATTNKYREPAADAGALAGLRGYSDRQSTFEWSRHYIISIDDKAVSYDAITVTFNNQSSQALRILPGEHYMKIYSEFNREHSELCPCEASTELKAMLTGGMEYRLKAMIEEPNVVMWIEDPTGRPITEIARTKYLSMPKPLIIPIPLLK